MTLELLHSDNGNCTKCNLRANCSQVVVGKGPSRTPLMFIGEAPGRDEDMIGEPFVGRCGKLLDVMLEKAGCKRHKVYITNTVKCNPRENNKNRPPNEDEVNACKRWLWEEIKLVQPRLIVTFGRTPTYCLLKKQLKKSFAMDTVIGKVHSVDYTSAMILPCYHPAYILRNQSTMEIAQEIINGIREKLK